MMITIDLQGVNMYIKRIEMENIRCFSDTTEIYLSPGLNYFVGENNAGKSSIMFALDYLRNGTSDSNKIYSNNTESSKVIVDIAGDDLEETLETGDFSQLNKYLHEASYTNSEDTKFKILRARRQSHEETIQQGKRDITITSRKIAFWNPETEQFENPTGIDAKFKALLDLNFIYADDAPDTHVDMGSSKTLGKLISNAITDIHSKNPWIKFAEAHQALFENKGEGTVQNALSEISDDLSQILTTQYGDAQTRFSFEIPEPVSLLKSGHVMISRGRNGEDETIIENKGTGLQRAFMLALLQVYSARLGQKGLSDDRRMIFGLDEPETWLHPKAQLNLAEAIRKISNTQQVFLITHSPYMLQGYNPKDSCMLVVKHNSDSQRIQTHEDLNTCRLPYVSWNAINYYAFGIPSIEFMDELYGHFQTLCLQKSHAGEKEIVDHLQQLGANSSLQWNDNRKPGISRNIPISVYVRNSVHHPENNLNKRYTNEQLSLAIQELESAIHTWISKKK